MFPGQLARGQHLLPTTAITGLTAGLIVADPYAMPYFRDHAQNIDDINDVFDPLITSAEVILVPASLMVAGYIRHDDYRGGLPRCLRARLMLTALWSILESRRLPAESGLPMWRLLANLMTPFFPAENRPLREAAFPQGMLLGPSRLPPWLRPAITPIAGCLGPRMVSRLWLASRA